MYMYISFDLITKIYNSTTSCLHLYVTSPPFSCLSFLKQEVTYSLYLIK